MARRFGIRVTRVALLLAFLSGLAYAEEDVWKEPAGSIYWGDLHVHTAYSLDAWASGWTRGRYLKEAGIFALYCAKLDFVAFTDHSEMLTNADYWKDAIATARAMNEAAGRSLDGNGDPAIVVFPGWEWTQQKPWGHKNVIMKYDDPNLLPAQAARCYRGFLGPGLVTAYLRGRYTGQEAITRTPGELFDYLRRTCTRSGTGCATIVIPHGNAWGQLTDPRTDWLSITPNMFTDWPAQLNPRDHDPDLQRAIEVYSQHGNSEQYRPLHPEYRYYLEGQEVDLKTCRENAKACRKVCSEPNASFEPCCFRAGEIVKARCQDPDSEFCRREMDRAKESGVPFAGFLSPGEKKELKPEFRDRPAEVKAEEWGACDQCLDCYQPASVYRPQCSVQQALATGYFAEGEDPLYYRFGFVASTDNHSAMPGSVKEVKRFAELHSPGFGVGNFAFQTTQFERIANYLNPGGLVAIISPRRTREDLWQNLFARRTYGTTGARIEVWLRAVVEEEGREIVEMGAETVSQRNPVFYLRARGALQEDPTCPYAEEPEIRQNLSEDEFREVCFAQCFRPLDERVKIARIEVVKIRQPLTPQEADQPDLRYRADNPAGLIFDPYQVERFDAAQIEWSWTDPDFIQEPPGRTVAYYFRVIQEPTEGYNCNPAALLRSAKTCNGAAPSPEELNLRTNPQDGSPPAPLKSIADDCYTDVNNPAGSCEERAWTSPVYVTRR